MSTYTLTEIATNWNYDGDGPPFPFFLFPLFWLLFFAGVITVVTVLRRRRDTTAGRRAGERTLAERYASGEIDADEYRTRRAVLRED